MKKKNVYNTVPRQTTSHAILTVDGVVPPNNEYCVLLVVGGAGEGGGRGDPEENPKISIPGTAEPVSGGKIPPWLTMFPLFIPSTRVKGG